LRVTAYVLRFIHNIRNPTNKHITAYLTVSEIRNAHTVVIKLTQNHLQKTSACLKNMVNFQRAVN
jgi:hypothetical protein